MLLKDMFKKPAYISLDKEKEAVRTLNETNPSVPDGLFTKCKKCGEMVYSDDCVANLWVCPKCGSYFRIDARTRLKMVADEDSFEEWDKNLEFANPIDYPNYIEKVTNLRKTTGLDEAVITGRCTVKGRETVIGIMSTQFMMGSMGGIVGEKITRAVERATEMRLPVILFCCSGGARMQEGSISLMQMAKTAAALKRHDKEGLLYISVLTDPTTGGVTASFAMLGDIILAEPGALIGFAGPRVIKQTIGQELPEGFQRAEFLLEHGLIDNIVQRKNLKNTLASLLKMHTIPVNNRMEEFKNHLDEVYSKKIDITMEEYTDESNQLTPWDKVLEARSAKRPTARDYIPYIAREFYELHGDRAFRDDGAIIGGIGMFGRQPVTVIGQQKGRTTKENIKRNFGMPYPEGYRKALRLMKQAEKFKRPIICFVDTPGAYCGIGAEERGQGEAIARNLFEMADLKVPILSVVLGEGGSGGALALAVANEVWMMENAIYSVLSPEGFASILWKDAKLAPEAAGVMKVTAGDLKEMGIIDRVLLEYPVATMDNLRRVALYMKRKMAGFLLEYGKHTEEELVSERYERFRRM